MILDGLWFILWLTKTCSPNMDPRYDGFSCGNKKITQASLMLPHRLEMRFSTAYASHSGSPLVFSLTRRAWAVHDKNGASSAFAAGAYASRVVDISCLSSCSGQREMGSFFSQEREFAGDSTHSALRFGLLTRVCARGHFRGLEVLSPRAVEFREAITCRVPAGALAATHQQPIHQTGTEQGEILRIQAPLVASVMFLLSVSH